MNDHANPEYIIRQTAEAFEVPREYLAGGRRTAYRTLVRWAAAYLLRRSGQFSYSDIARLLRYQDHTSARSAVAGLQKRMATSSYLRDKVQALAVQLHLPAELAEPKGGTN